MRKKLPHLPFFKTWPANKLRKLTGHINEFNGHPTSPQDLQYNKTVGEDGKQVLRTCEVPRQHTHTYIYACIYV